MPSSLQQQVCSSVIEVESDFTGGNASSRDVAAAEASASFRSSSVSVRGGGWRGGNSGRGRSTRGRFGGVGYSGPGRWSGDEAPVCKFFLQGRCSAGIGCRFKHSEEAAVLAAHYSPSESKPPQATEPDMKPRREYCPVAAAVLQHAKVLQDNEERLYEHLEGPFYSIDVEAIATGYGHNPMRHRISGRIAVVDDQDNVLVDEIVRHDPMDIVSYLTPLTGLSKLVCSSEKAKPLQEVIQLVKDRLPANAVLVGQSIHNDIQWLGLEEGKDYREAFDTALIFRQRLPKNLPLIVAKAKADPDSPFHNSCQNVDQAVDEDDTSLPPSQPGDDDLPTKYRVFSLRHTCLNLLLIDIQKSTHNPVTDAKYSLILFHKCRKQSVLMLRATRDSLHRAPPTPSFVQNCPLIDGVCLSKISYKYKHAARFIWTWWTHLFGGALIQKFKSAQIKNNS